MDCQLELVEGGVKKPTYKPVFDKLKQTASFLT
jgi:hypothetical protein